LHFSIGFGVATLSARELFLDCLVGLAGDKVRQLLAEDGFVHDRRLFSHLIDETVLFEKELVELYGYDDDDDGSVGDDIGDFSDNVETGHKKFNINFFHKKSLLKY
jgi:hypothetical protein